MCESYDPRVRHIHSYPTQFDTNGSHLVLILIKLFPFLASYEISVTMKQNYI